MDNQKKLSGTALIDVLDKDTRNDIIFLHSKLKTLLAEIQSKKTDAVPPSEEREQQLTVLSEEIHKALASMEALVKLVLTDDFDANEFPPVDTHVLTNFRHAIGENIEKVKEIEEQLK